MSLGGESSGGLKLYQVDLHANHSTQIATLAEDGNYQVLDQVSSGMRALPVPEPSSAILIFEGFGLGVNASPLLLKLS